MENILNNYLTALKSYVKFDGRSTREEFWHFVLANAAVMIVLAILNLNLLSNLYSLAVLVPSLAVGSRRLHDINKSGWMQLVVFIPLAGIIWLIVLFAQKGEDKDNTYGKVTKNTVPKKDSGDKKEETDKK